MKQVSSDMAVITIDEDSGTVTKQARADKWWNKIGRPFKREVEWLIRLRNFDRVPKVIEVSCPDKLVMTYCGEPVTHLNLPHDWREQMRYILTELKKYGCCHNDIKPSEILVKDGLLYLIDFNWSTKQGEEIPRDWPEGLGCQFKAPHGFDDQYSFEVSIKKLNDIKAIAVPIPTRVYVLAPTLHTIAGGVKKLIHYWQHASAGYDARIVNYNEYFKTPGSVDLRYLRIVDKESVLTEEQFYSRVSPCDVVLFAPATINYRLKQRPELKNVRMVNLEMGFAGRNCDYIDSFNITDEISEFICFGQVESDDIYRSCKRNYPVIPIGIDLKKYKPKPRSRIKNLVGIYIDDRHRIPTLGNCDAVYTGSKEIAGYAMDVFMKEYFDLKPGRDFTFKLVDRANWYTEEEMIEMYQSCDIFISLNRYEGPFLVVLEAMACGCAVICTDAKGTDDLVVPWRTALRVSPNDPGYVSHALRKLLYDTELKERIRSGGLEMVQAHSLDQERAKLLRYIKSGKV